MGGKRIRYGRIAAICLGVWLALWLCAGDRSPDAAERLEFPGGWYVEALPTREYAALIRDSHIETHAGRVPLPGQNALYLRIKADGSIAAVGGADDRAYEWARGGWSVLGPAFGVNAVIYDGAGGLVVVSGPGPTGSQGWRYVADDGRLVSGDSTYADPGRHLWEYTDRGEIACGQGGDEEGLQCLIRGRRVLVEPGVVRFVRFNRAGDQVALAWVRQDTRTAGILWITVAELEALPTYAIPAPAPPVPPAPPAPAPAPQPEPASLIDDVRAERAKIAGVPNPAQLGAILNRIAWKHRAAGWGLSGKNGGNRCPMPPPVAKWIACDILHHQPTNRLYDVFGSSETEARPMWLRHANPPPASRPWVAPIEPSGAAEPEPVPEPQPDPAVPALKQRIAELEQELQQARALGQVAADRAAALEAERNALRAQLDALMQEPPPTCLVEGPGWIRSLFRISCRVVR